jgi:hypothetical protein
LFGHFNVLVDGITIAYNVKYLYKVIFWETNSYSLPVKTCYVIRQELQLCLHLSDKLKSLNFDLKTFGTIETKDTKPIKPVVVVDEKRGSYNLQSFVSPEGIAFLYRFQIQFE